MSTLYISDLDGTLLGDDSRLSEETIDKLNCLIEGEVDFVIATARNYPSAYERVRHLKYKNYLILSNGAQITKIDGTPVWIARMDNTLIEELFAFSGEFATSFIWTSLKGENKVMTHRDPSDAILVFKAFREKYSPQAFLPFEGLHELLLEDIITVTMLDTHEKTREMEKRLMESPLSEKVDAHLMPYPELDGLFTLSILPKATNKGAAIKELLRLTGKEPSSIVAFGDNENDKTMFKVADVGVAVGNANPALMEKADLVIGSNDESSVARYIWEAEHEKK
ncbi:MULTISPECIES: HAD family hydrolase [unclassified Fusibacter]|uniref:HAD family hydrolase n=1 Tax=unclassified Fusibacter TaxID=2624464 RepID=UPI0013E90DC9|nr:MULTISPECIES: HAD family hydrolase [unclassified Fusibacter]MCK8061368.1 HAD family hydrolase [Fusibacter sp. A2]NPE23589.1 HAD family hydrolase [Fusibacter sp. A1]